MVVATASLIALVVMLGWTATREGHGRTPLLADAGQMQRVLLGIAAVVGVVAAIAFFWTLTRPS